MPVKLFLTILEISIAMSAVILLLLALSPLLGRRYSPGLRHLLWLVVAVRLLIPLNAPWEGALRLDLFAGAKAAAVELGFFAPNPAAATQDGNAQGRDEAAGQQAGEQARPPLTQAQLAAIFWALGAGLFLSYHLGAYLFACRRLKRWSAPAGREIADVLEAVKRELGMESDVSAYVSSKAASPLLVGFLRPRIILPDEALAPGQLRFMLRHELWHLKRADLWRKLLLLLANAAHWFNPLVYWMEHRANQDIELACDADVLRESGAEERRAYGYAVLSFIERGWRCATPLTTRFSGGKRRCRERFRDIVDTAMKKRGTALLCSIVVLAVITGCGVRATAQPAPLPVAAETAAGAGAPTPQLTAEQAVPAAQHVQDKPADASDREIGRMAWPVPGYSTVTETFGPRYEGQDYHTGVDIAGVEGKDIFGADVIAAADGVVMVANTGYTQGVGYGQYIIIDHEDGVKTLYGQLSEVEIISGQTVKAGDIIGKVGATGFAREPNLHFEVRVSENGSDNYTCVNPMPYIASIGLIWPTEGGYVSAGRDAYPGHTGMDIAVPNGTGTPIYAAASGTVLFARETGVGYGNYIIIDHGNGYQTLYAQNDKLLVTVGDTVVQGQKIAEMGKSGHSTGVHLHFEIRSGGKPLDPKDFIGETPPESKTA